MARLVAILDGFISDDACAVVDAVADLIPVVFNGFFALVAIIEALVAATFVVLPCCVDVFTLVGCDHFLKIPLLPLAVVSMLARGDSDIFPVLVVAICDVLDAFFKFRRVNVFDAIFCEGISMFVLHLVTLRVACNEVVRLNGIFDMSGFVFFGDVGSETITGISPSEDGSSLINVLCRINVSDDCVD